MNDNTTTPEDERDIFVFWMILNGFETEGLPLLPYNVKEDDKDDE